MVFPWPIDSRNARCHPSPFLAALLCQVSVLTLVLLAKFDITDLRLDQLDGVDDGPGLFSHILGQLARRRHCGKPADPGRSDNRQWQTTENANRQTAYNTHGQRKEVFRRPDNRQRYSLDVSFFCCWDAVIVTVFVYTLRCLRCKLCLHWKKVCRLEYTIQWSCLPINYFV